jgi:type II secretory pathway pseudopilin PulG
MRFDQRPASRPRRCAGFSYIVLLVVVALIGLGSARVGVAWEHADRREREQELLRIGQLYADALRRARLDTPGSSRGYPARLEDLLLDARFVGTRRHIRRLYPDPLAPARPWGLIRDEHGAIIAVYSQDERQPLTQVQIISEVVALPAGAASYADWKFMPRQQVLPSGSEPSGR